MKRRSFVVAVVAALWVLAACSGPSSEDQSSLPDDTSTGGTVAQAVDPDIEPPAAPIDGAVAGGTVTVLSGYEPSTLDPTWAYDPLSVPVLSGLLTRSLTQYVYEPAQGAAVLVPDIATDLGTPNADFTEWTFTIRDGVRFQDGTEVTAEHVAYGIKRSLDRTAFDGGATYSNDYFLDGDTYDGPFQDGTNYPGVVVEGDTVTVKMARPFPDMPYWAAYPAIGPIPEQGSDPATYGRHPLATGPYQVASYTPGKSLTLIRNDQWDPDTDPGRHAYPDRYVFQFNRPAKSIDSTILGDTVAAQTALSMSSVLADDYRRAQKLDRLTEAPGGCTFSWLMDYRDITDIGVRRAIGYAYPYHDAAVAAGGIPGATALFGESILPPGFPGRRDYSVLDTAPGQSDLDKARALLTEAGYPPGEYELAWPYDVSNPTDVQTTRLMIDAFEAAGFRATPLATDSIDEFAEVNGDPTAPINLRFSGWCSDWLSGSGWFPVLFHSEGSYNGSGFAEPAVDAEIERIRLLPIGEQPAAWAALDEWIMTDYYPTVITNYSGVALPHGARIGGMNFDSTIGITYKDIHVIP